MERRSTSSSSDLVWPRRFLSQRWRRSGQARPGASRRSSDRFRRNRIPASMQGGSGQRRGWKPRAGAEAGTGASRGCAARRREGFGRTSQTAGADRDAAVSARRLLRRPWLGLRRQLRENSHSNARSSRRGRSDESGGPPLFALSLEIQRNIAHGSGLPLRLSVIGVHGVSKENASAKQPEKCHRNHRIRPCTAASIAQRARRFRPG